MLAGGTGGAKLARGMLDVVGPDDLVVIANTGDDVEIYGGYVSPDPDLVSFWLADRIDERGWGLAGDTFEVMDGLRDLGEEVWFNLGDADLAIALLRAAGLGAGERLSVVQADLTRRLGLRAEVLVMSDRPVRTRIRAAGRNWSLQEYLIRGRRPDGDWPAIDDVTYVGAAGADTTPEVLAALGAARAIVIGPSNPVLSIGPMLAIPELAAALAASPAPTVAVSPIVGGSVLKGPTATCLAWAGVSASGDGVAALYGNRIDGIVLDAPLTPAGADEAAAPDLATLVCDLMMDGAAGRRRLAAQTLTFAAGLR